MRMGERREGREGREGREEIRVLTGPNGADVLLAKVGSNEGLHTPLLSGKVKWEARLVKLLAGFRPNGDLT